MKKILYFLTLILAPYIFAQSDCSTAISICQNAAISYTPSGSGSVQEGNSGCLTSVEHFSVWYQFTAGTSGTLTFLITPNAVNDYDFAVYGPNAVCGALGAPIRCSYALAGPTGQTGLNMTDPDTSEGAGGDGFVRYLDVIAGETYYLFIDNFVSTTVGFVLTFGGTATLNSPFNDPVLAPNPFIAPGPNNDGIVIICTDPAVFDFTTLDAQIINGNPNFIVKYYNNTNDALANVNAIITPIPVNTAQTYHYAISYSDPNNPTNILNTCRTYGTVNFIQGAITVNNATLTGCSNNNSGVATYDLTTANVFAGPPGANTFTYYQSMTDLANQVNPITNPTAYVAAQGAVYVEVTTPEGCTGSSTITLGFFPPLVQTPVTLVACFREGNPTTGQFDLTVANVSTTPGITKEYYISNQDAVNQTNPILNFVDYISSSSEIFIRITNAEGCWNIVKVTLIVTPPTYSLVLKDKIICVEQRTTLDAGAGFDDYLWSNGEITQVITDVSVGAYYVDLKKNGCITRQNVKVLASPIPVVTNVEITNNSAIITVNGGVPPYQYSLDGTTYQDSNIFNGLPRGEVKVYVKDSFECLPVISEFTVPNLINAITPNNDGVNDFVDYSALAYKKNLVFTVYDRYGNKIHTGDKNNLYRWNGTVNGGKKVITGTYWYTITWNQPVGNAEVQYSGWIMVKNR